MSAPDRKGLRAFLTEMLDSGMTEHEATDAALDSVLPKELKAFARPAIRNEARIAARMRVRVSESAARTAVTASPGGRVGARIKSYGTIVSARNELAKKTFAMPDGTRVEWNRATPEQHDQRAAWYRKLAGSNVEAAKLHETYAKTIREQGVSCFAEITDPAIRASLEDAA